MTQLFVDEREIRPGIGPDGLPRVKTDDPWQRRTVDELGAEMIERWLPGVGLLVFESAGIGQWLTQKGEPAKKAKRCYTLFPLEGEKFICDGVSSIPGCLHKPALLGWYEDYGARGAVKAHRLGELEDVPDEEIIERVRFLGLGADDQRDAAALRGTAIHAVLDDLAHNREPDPSSMPPEWRPWFDGAIAAWDELQPEAVEIEQIVCHPEDRYAGRFDLVARVDGALTLLDYKTGKGRVYSEAHYQARLYERARVRCGFEPVERIVVVGVDDRGGFTLSEGLVSDEEAEALLRLYRSKQRVDRALGVQRRAA